MGIGAVNVDLLARGKLGKEAKRSALPERYEKGVERDFGDPRLLKRRIDRIGANSLTPVVGGSSFNVIRAAAGLGLDLRLGFIGVAGSTNRWIDCPLDPRGELNALGVDTTYLVNEPQEPAGVCLAILEGRDRTLWTHPGANSLFAGRLLDERRVVPDDLARYLASARVIHVSSFFDKETAGAICSLIEAAERLNPEVLVSFDPGHVWASRARNDADLERLLRRSNFLLLNEAELRLLSTAPTHADEEQAANSILDSYQLATAILVLKKPGGAAVFHSGGNRPHFEYRRIPLLPWQVRDPIAAGDVFAAGFLAAQTSAAWKAQAGAALGTEAARFKIRHNALDGYKLSAIARRSPRSLAYRVPRLIIQPVDYLLTSIPPVTRTLIWIGGVATGLVALASVLLLISRIL